MAKVNVKEGGPVGAYKQMKKDTKAIKGALDPAKANVKEGLSINPLGAAGAGTGHKLGIVKTKPKANVKEKTMRRESTDISNFLKSLTEKNYAEANKYLHAVLDTKMKGRIRDTATN